MQIQNTKFDRNSPRNFGYAIERQSRAPNYELIFCAFVQKDAIPMCLPFNDA